MQNDFVNEYFFKTKKMKDFARVVDKGAAFYVGAYYIPRKGAEKAADLIQKNLASIGTDGTWQKILKRYTDPSDSLK